MFLQVSVWVHGGVSASGPRGMSHTHTHTPGQTPPCPVHAGIHTHPHPVHAGIHTPPCLVHAEIHTPPCPVHAGIHAPPLHSACWDTVNKRPVRIPLECILVALCCFRPPTKLREGNVFTGVCQSFCSQGWGMGTQPWGGYSPPQSFCSRRSGGHPPDTAG